MLNFIKNYISNKFFYIKNEIIYIIINIISVFIINFFFLNFFLVLILFISIILALFIGKNYDNYIFGFLLITIPYTIIFIISIIFRKLILDKFLKKLMSIFLENNDKH